MHAGGATDYREPGTRRGRVPCKICGLSVEVVRLRRHLRADHQLDTASVEAQYLAALMELRKTRRSQF